MSLYYAYIYIDPRDNIPFYVGKGKGNRAFAQHNNKQVNGRLRQLKNLGLKPIIEIINSTNEMSAYWLEKVGIAAFGRRDLNQGTLLNHTDGGDGGTVSIALIERMINDNPMKKGMTNSSSFKKGQKSPYPWTEKRKEKGRSAKLGSKNPQYGNSKASEHLNACKASCINCRKTTTIGNIIRWHGEKCKNVSVPR